jgi:hypothetical protein
LFVERDGGEHERLGEEAAADGGLLADGADAERGEAFRAGELAMLEEKDGSGFGAGAGGFRGSPGLRIETWGTRSGDVARCGFLQDEGAELVDGAASTSMASLAASRCAATSSSRDWPRVLKKAKTRCASCAYCSGVQACGLPSLQGCMHLFISP